MAALAEPLLMTVEQFQSLPERGDVLEELHWGQLVTLSRPRPWHVKLQVKLAQLLQPIAAGRGYVLTELPFCAAGEYDLRAADVAFISKKRWDAANDRDLQGAPELVVEVLSPSNTKARLGEYAALCLANGCQEFWAINYKSKSVTVTNRTGQSLKYSSGMNVPLIVLGGTAISVDEIFS